MVQLIYFILCENFPIVYNNISNLENTCYKFKEKGLIENSLFLSKS